MENLVSDVGSGLEEAPPLSSSYIASIAAPCIMNVAKVGAGRVGPVILPTTLFNVKKERLVVVGSTVKKSRLSENFQALTGVDELCCFNNAIKGVLPVLPALVLLLHFWVIETLHQE